MVLIPGSTFQKSQILNTQSNAIKLKLLVYISFNIICIFKFF